MDSESIPSQLLNHKAGEICEFISIATTFEGTEEPHNVLRLVFKKKNGLRLVMSR
jgi:hypothetical protein